MKSQNNLLTLNQRLIYVKEKHQKKCLLCSHFHLIFFLYTFNVFLSWIDCVKGKTNFLGDERRRRKNQNEFIYFYLILLYFFINFAVWCLRSVFCIDVYTKSCWHAPYGRFRLIADHYYYYYTFNNTFFDVLLPCFWWF